TSGARPPAQFYRRRRILERTCAKLAAMFLRRGKAGLEAVFGSLELRVLEALWRRESSASVRDVHADFPNAAYTTLMTTMERLHRKGILNRERVGRAFVYDVRFSREELETA